MAISIFKNKQQQQLFDRDGYILIPFLSIEEVEALKKLYARFSQNNPDSFYSTSFSLDLDLKLSINREVETIYGSKVAGLFTDVKKLGSSFLTKPTGLNGKMPVHQDWTVVDEKEFQSVTIWVPLQDVNETNGAIMVLPGSQKFSKTLRSPNMPGEFDGASEVILKQMKVLNMKAGEAFIFNHALIHASTLNKTALPRVALTYGLVSDRAKLYLYLRNHDGRVEKYEMPDDMFLYYTGIGKPPEIGKKVEEFDYEIKPVNEIQLNKMMNNSKEYVMKPIFKNEEKQSFFEKEGYVVFPLLNEDEVIELKQFYVDLQIKDEAGYGFHVSMDQPDKSVSHKVREKIWGVAVPKLSEHLRDFKPFVASFVIKDPNPKGVVPAHQDWSFCDKEDEGYCSITCWIALVDTNIDNGAMGVIKGSHKMIQNHRPSPSPQTPVPLEEHMFSIFPYLTTLNMKAGEVLMFDNRTFHASPPNTTDSVRLAAGVGVTQSDAKLVHYYLKPDGTKSTLLKYAVDEGFYLKYNNASLAKLYNDGKSIEGYEMAEELPYVFPTFTSEELIEIIKENGNDFNVPMCEKLAVLFNYNMDGSKKEVTIEEVQEVEAKVSNEAPVVEEWKWIDERTFFQKYTPLNIVREIKKRVVGA